MSFDTTKHREMRTYGTAPPFEQPPLKSHIARLDKPSFLHGKDGFFHAHTYEYPPEVRKIIYTTNMIEGLNRQFRQITKNKPSFTSDDSLRRMLYLASQRIVKHWHARCQNWDLVLSQLQLMFADRAAG